MTDFDEQIRQSTLRWGSMMAQQAIDKLDQEKKATPAPKPTAVWQNIPKPQQDKILKAYEDYYRATKLGEDEIKKRLTNIQGWTLDKLLTNIKFYSNLLGTDQMAAKHLAPIMDDLRKAGLQLLRSQLPDSLSSVLNGETEATIPSVLLGSSEPVWNNFNAREKDLITRHFRAYYKASKLSDEEIAKRLANIDKWTASKLAQNLTFYTPKINDPLVAQYLSPILPIMRKLITESTRLPEELSRQEQVLFRVRSEAEEEAKQLAKQQNIPEDKVPEFIRTQIPVLISKAIIEKGKAARLAAIRGAAVKFATLYQGKETQFQEVYDTYLRFLSSQGTVTNPNFSQLFKRPESAAFISGLLALLPAEEQERLNKDAEDRAVLYFESQNPQGASPQANQLKKTKSEFESLRAESEQLKYFIEHKDQIRRFQPTATDDQLNLIVTRLNTKLGELNKKLPAAEADYNSARQALLTIHQGKANWDNVFNGEKLGALWDKSREATAYINGGKYGAPRELETFTKVYGVNATNLADWQAQVGNLSGEGDNPNDYTMGLATLTSDMFGTSTVPSPNDLTQLFDAEQIALINKIDKGQISVEDFERLPADQIGPLARYLGANRRLINVEGKVLIAARENGQWRLLNQSYSTYRFSDDHTIYDGRRKVWSKNLLDGLNNDTPLSTRIKAYWEKTVETTGSLSVIKATAVFGEDVPVYSVSRVYDQDANKFNVVVRPLNSNYNDYQTIRTAVQAFGSLNQQLFMGNNPLAGNDAMTRQMLGLAPWTPQRINEACRTLQLNDNQKAVITQVLTGQARLVIRGEKTSDAVKNSDFFLYNISDGTTRQLPKGSEERIAFEKVMTLNAAGRSPANTPEAQLGFALNVYQNDLHPQTARDNYIDTIAVNLAARLTQAMTAEQLNDLTKWDENKTGIFSSGFASVLVGCGHLPEGGEKIAYDRSVQTWAETNERAVKSRFQGPIAQLKQQGKDTAALELQQSQTLTMVAELRDIYLKLGTQLEAERSWSLFSNLDQNAINSNARELGTNIIAYTKSPNFGVVRGN